MAFGMDSANMAPVGKEKIQSPTAKLSAPFKSKKRPMPKKMPAKSPMPLRPPSNVY